jgi:hypothetical protein
MEIEKMHNLTHLQICVDYVQGRLFSKPLLTEFIETCLKNTNNGFPVPFPNSIESIHPAMRCPSP